MSVDQDIADSSKQLAADVKINHDITHGDEHTEIPTEGGPVPTIKKRLKDIETAWAKNADPLAEELSDVVDTTKDYKDEAKESADRAAEELVKVQDEGTKQTNRVAAKGTEEADKVTSEGNTQVARVVSEGDTQTNRAKAEAAAALREEDYQLAYAIDILKGLSAIGPRDE